MNILSFSAVSQGRKKQNHVNEEISEERRMIFRHEHVVLLKMWISLFSCLQSSNFFNGLKLHFDDYEKSAGNQNRGIYHY